MCRRTPLAAKCPGFPKVEANAYAAAASVFAAEAKRSM